MSGKAPTSSIITAKTLSQEKTPILTIPLGFIAISHMSKLIVLSFRGIGSPKNWAEDFKREKVDVTEFCKCCQVHHGSREFWRGISESVIKLLIRLHSKSPNYRIAIVGHYLGGAEAILAAGDIRNQGSWLTDNFELYSYRSSRVGNAAVRYLSQQSDQSYRVTATQDPIPRMPPAMLGYQHTSPEYWIHSNPENPRPGKVSVLWGYFNSKGASQFDGLHMDFHHHYLEYISGCDPDPPTDPSGNNLGETRERLNVVVCLDLEEVVIQMRFSIALER